MKHSISLFVSLAIFWLVNSGHYTILLLLIGVASVVFVVLIARRMDVIDHESQPIHLTFKLPSYYMWLIKEVLSSNIKVVKHIWLGNKTITPTMTYIKCNQKTDMGKVIFANSITLTPGTVAIDMDDDQILVHALVEEELQNLINGDMDHRVCQLEKS
ncbi:MAG: Na+/H+ antiporter subunit E [Marinicellaceae bacterium]